MSSVRSPLLIPAGLWICGLITGKFISLSLSWLFLLLLVELLIYLLLKHKQLLIITMIFSCGLLRMELAEFYPENHIRVLLEEKEELIRPLHGIIISEVTFENGYYRSLLKLTRIGDCQITGVIRFKSKQSDLKYGNVISTTAAINGVRASSNPLASDYRELLRFKNIHGYGLARRSVIINAEKGSFFQKIIIGIRKFIRKRIELRLPEYSGFIKAILLGDRTGLQDQRDMFTRAGLSHILAVSGLHIGLITIIIFTVLKIFIRQRIMLRILTILLLMIFGGICSWSPSVSRAVIMISLYLISQMIQRKPDPNNILAASLILITAISPYQFFAVGLQLSFTAVFVLLNLIPSFTAGIQKIRISNIYIRKFVISVLTLVVVSFSLSVFLAPLTLFYFNQFNLNGIVGNLLAVPLISIILPLSMLVTAAPQILSLHLFYRNSLKVVLDLFFIWGKLASRCPLYWNFIPFTIIQMILIFSWLFLMTRLLKGFTRLRVVSVVILIAVNTAFCFRSGSDKLTVTFFDCGLGDLSLIETPAREIIMIDCGPINRDPNNFARSTLPYLQKKGIKELDWLIITHAHNDHYGGYIDVFANLKVRNLMVTDEFQTREIWQRFCEEIEREGTLVYTVNDTTHLKSGDLELKILHPDKDYSNDNINNMSIVCRLDYGEISILFNGDLEEEGEHYLITRYSRFLDCDITKVGHHGSKTSSTEEYIKIVSPEYAVISTSVKNRFDFPHQSTLRNYSFLGMNLIITGRDGAFTVVSDRINTECNSVLKKNRIQERGTY